MGTVEIVAKKDKAVMAVNGKIIFRSGLWPAAKILIALNVKNKAKRTAKILVMIPGNGKDKIEPLWSNVKSIRICVTIDAK